MIQKYRQITDAERAELESIGWWDHFDFADVLKIDLETSFEFIHGRGQLLEQGAIEQHPAMTAQLHQIYYDPVAAALDLEAHAAEYALGKDMDIQRMIETIPAEAKPDF